MSHKKQKHHKSNKENSCNDIWDELRKIINLNNNADYMKSITKDNNKADNSESASNLNKISDEDMESLRLLSLQLKGILIDYLGETFLWNSTMQGISYILEKYDNIKENDHTNIHSRYYSTSICSGIFDC